MLPVRRLREALLTLPTVTLHGPWSRAIPLRYLHGPPPGAPAGGPPQPLWPAGAALRGARFTPRGGFPTIYLASDHQIALIEAQAVFQTPHGPVVTLDHQPWALVSVDGVLSGVLDLTDPAMQRALGTSLAELTGDWLYTQSTGRTPPTQSLGRVVHESGRFTAILYVSARNPAHGRGIAVFSDRLVAGGADYLQVVDPDGRLGQRLP
jgi:RES domain-containing protein